MSDAAAVQSKSDLGSGAMFDGIAERYDLLNRLMSLGMDHYWRFRMLRALGRPQGTILDVATGTGDVAFALRRRFPSCSVVGLDPSTGMLAVAEKKQQERRITQVDFVAGDAQALPFDDATFAATTIAFGIRNVPDRDLALQQMARVTATGGRVAILELGEPGAGPVARIARWYVRNVIPRVGAWLSDPEAYAYLRRSIEAFPEPAQFAAQMRRAGLKEVQVKRLAFGACNLYVGVA